MPEAGRATAPIVQVDDILAGRRDELGRFATGTIGEAARMSDPIGTF